MNLFGEIGNELGLSSEQLGNLSSRVIAFTAVFSVIWLLIYFFRAFAIADMAKKTGLNKPLMSFIPIINLFTFGKVAEKYRKKNGVVSAKLGFWLLVLNIISIILSILLCIFIFLSVNKILDFADEAVKNDTAMSVDMFSSVIPVILNYVALIIIAIIFAVIRYIALWRIFAIFSFKNAILFTVFSVIIPVSEPVFLMLIRKNIPDTEPWESKNPQFEII